MENVPQVIKDQHMYVKSSKCAFGVQEVEYLWHIVSKGVKMDPRKINVVVDWLIHTSLKNFKIFLTMEEDYYNFF